MDVAGVFRGIGYARYWQKETWNRNKRLCFIICLAGNYLMQPDMDGWRPLSGPAHKFQLQPRIRRLNRRQLPRLTHSPAHLVSPMTA